MDASLFNAEKKTQFERDKAAFERLPDWQKTGTKAFAVPGFYLRHAIVSATKMVVGAVEIAFNLVFRLPYILAWKGLKKLADGAIGLAKLGIKSLTGLGKGLLAAGRKTLGAAGSCVTWLEQKGWITAANKEKKLETFEKGKVQLLQLRNDLVEWEHDTKEKIDKSWKKTKNDLKEFGHKAKDTLEKHGSVGLFRLTKWALNPQTPSGKPLLYWKPLNKAAGFTLAAVGFTALAYEVGKLTALIKIWNAKFLASLIKGTSMSMHELAAETGIHAAVTAGGVAMKFVTLPIIAATRQTLKSTTFTQGIAYQYNLRLNALEEKKAVRREKNKYLRWLGQKKPLTFIARFVTHIVQQASPEFYEIKMRQYKETTPPLPAALPDQALSPDFKAVAPPPSPSAPTPTVLNPPPPIP